MASSRRGENVKITGPQFSKKKKKKRNKSHSLRPAATSVCSSSHLHIQLENETKITRASSFTVPSLCGKKSPLSAQCPSVSLSLCEWA